AGGQAGPPAPAACAKYCPTGKPPTSFELTSQRDSLLLKRAFRGRPCPLTLPSILVGNIPDCAQRQNHHFLLLISSFDFQSTFELPNEE
ncbi:hypothetical protein CS536_22380, partial [Yersinia kristensenii]